MRIPTYLNEENYILLKHDEVFSTVRVCNPLENDSINEAYEIYFYGTRLANTLICGHYDPKTDTKKPCLLIARCRHTGKEILLYDEASYGYNSIFCDSYPLEDIINRPLLKLAIPPAQIELTFAYNIDFDEEKEDFDFDENDFTESINGQKISFEEVKKNCFDYIKITALDEKNNKTIICELELA